MGFRGVLGVMKVAAVIGLSVGLIAALPAFAFQEQKVGGGAPAAAPAAPPAPGGPQAPADMTLSPAEAPKKNGGTEVRIPGLGKLGVLPKMDFGLELLYGAADAKPPSHEPLDEPEADDLRIRGTLRHNF